MEDRKLLVIICKTAGDQTDVEGSLKHLLKEYSVPFRVITVGSPPEITKVLSKIRVKNYRAVAVYGGDGSVIETIKTFGQNQLPVLILPGGTANVLAKYYQLPSSLADCIRLYADGLYIGEWVDIATINDEPLVLDMHVGLWTEAIKDTPRKLKKQVGEAAYAWSALKKTTAAKLQTYEFSINNLPTRTVRGYTLIIANVGNHNILGLPLFPNDHAPGQVQLAIIKNISFRAMVAWCLYKIFGKNLDSVIEVHRAKEITITKAPKNILSDDDSQKVSLPLKISAGMYSAKLIVPPTRSQINILKKLWRYVRLILHRLRLRLRVLIGRDPLLRYSHVAPNLYLGGKYTSRAYKIFQSWGVTGIVSMRTHASPNAPEGIDLLALPTRDWSPPSLSDLRRGAAFIQTHIANGGSVYVHCRLGEGRGPTMAAAYLITKGFSVDEALTMLAKYRPVARPNRAQRKRLAEWQEVYNQRSK